MSKLDRDMQEARDSFSKFQARRALQEPAENIKMGVVGLLLLSVFIFALVGDEVVKSIIWYWAGFMTFLLICCVAQDIRITRKIKRLGIGL